jgi:hypothetical protein
MPGDNPLLPEAKLKKSRPIIGVVLVFPLGILCGFLATHLLYNYWSESILSSRAQTRKEAIVSRLDSKLDLNDRQEERVRAIVHETQEEIQSVRSQIRPQTEAVIEEAQVKIRAILTSEQVKKYEQMIAAHREKLRKRGL